MNRVAYLEQVNIAFVNLFFCLFILFVEEAADEGIGDS